MSLLDYWDTRRPSVKRQKTDKASSSQEREKSLGENDSTTLASPLIRASNPSITSLDGEISVDDEQVPSSQTELESSLPTIEMDNQVIDEYATSRDAKDHAEPDLQQQLWDGKWRKGKSSIYVDAFNLALETVLDEEAHLFDEAEMEVLRQWKELSYESQYLYVRAYTLVS